VGTVCVCNACRMTGLHSFYYCPLCLSCHGTHCSLTAPCFKCPFCREAKYNLDAMRSVDSTTSNVHGLQSSTSIERLLLFTQSLAPTISDLDTEENADGHDRGRPGDSFPTDMPHVDAFPVEPMQGPLRMVGKRAMRASSNTPVPPISALPLPGTSPKDFEAVPLMSPSLTEVLALATRDNEVGGVSTEWGKGEAQGGVPAVRGAQLLCMQASVMSEQLLREELLQYNDQESTPAVMARMMPSGPSLTVAPPVRCCASLNTRSTDCSHGTPNNLGQQPHVCGVLSAMPATLLLCSLHSTASARPC
jgi:hypothetical protein